MIVQPRELKALPGALIHPVDPLCDESQNRLDSRQFAASFILTPCSDEPLL